MSDPILDVRDLEVEFESYEGRHRVLNGIDLTVEEGETVALVGETGCGKSVTAKTIMGTLPTPPGEIVSGEVHYRGEDLLADSTAHKRAKGDEMSMIFQDPMTYLSPVFTVGTTMKDIALHSDSDKISWWQMFRRFFGGEPERVQEIRDDCVDILDRLRIPDPEGILDRYPVELSGGMRQRVLIALALINEPNFLIADEPTTALDVTVQDQILNLLKERIQNRGLSMLYITHNLGVARELADRIYIMYAGEIAEVGRTEDLFEAPLHPYTRGLLESIPKLTGFDSDGVPGQIPDYTDPPVGCRFAPRCPAYIAGECDQHSPKPRQVGERGREISCFLYQDGMELDEAADIAEDDETYHEPRSEQVRSQRGEHP